MIEGALKADGRIAAKNAVKIRAALRELADYKKLYLQYQETMPESSGNLARDRTRARAWAIMNVTQFRTEALASSLWRMWAEAYVLGTVAASEWLRITRELNKADDDVSVDWDNWKPGDRAATLMLQRPKAFQQILDSTNVTIRGLTRTSITDIGNSLAEAIDLGLDASSAALLIGRNVASPARALTIAITEQNRVISAATMERYKEAGLEKQEWAVSDPCDICAKNDGAIVPIGTSFPSGDTQPPAHPHCRCVLLPVIPGMEENDPMGVDGGLAPMPDGAVIADNAISSIEEEALTRSQIGRKIDVTDFVNSSRSYEADNAKMGEVINAQGWNKPSLVADPTEYEKLKASGDFVEVFRGGPKGLTEGLTSGNPWIGDGNAGPGTYVTVDAERAKAYASLSKMQTGDSEVITALIPKNIIEDAPNLLTSPENPLPSKWNGKKRADYVLNAADGKGAYESSYESSAKGDYVIYNTASMIIRGS
jgi:SPP1 gp7 family putative phage head morphogenesis protein